MANLWKLNEELDEILNEISDNEGVISEDTAKNLAIKENELNEQLTYYRHAISEYQANIELCNKERDRILKVKKTNENKIKTIKRFILDSVFAYGKNGKTNKYISTPIARFYTSTTETAEFNDARIETLLNTLETILIKANKYGVMTLGEECDIDHILNRINELHKMQCMENCVEYIPFTITDLTSIVVEYSTKGTIFDLLKDDHSVLRSVVSHRELYDRKNATSSSGMKLDINLADNRNEPPCTVAKLVKNTNLMIK